MLILLMGVKLRRLWMVETLRKLRKMLMEMKIVCLILCCLLGEGVCRGNRIKLGEKCSGMIGMGITLLRSWNSNRVTLEKKLNGPNIGCLCQVCMGCILMTWVNFNNISWPMILEQNFASVITAMLAILMMKMQILAYVLLCRYRSVHHLPGYDCWVNQL